MGARTQHSAAQTARGDAPGTTADPAPAPKRWVHSAAQKIPTTWLATAAAAVLLASTAAFGGLATVENEVPSLHPGDVYVNAGLEMSVVSAAIVDRYASVPAEGSTDRALALELEVRNIGVEPYWSGLGPLTAVRIAGIPGTPQPALRRDDRTFKPWLQPDVPARVILLWPVSASTAEGDLEVSLPVASMKEGTIQTSYWSYDGVGARVTVPLVDEGLGDAKPTDEEGEG